MVVQTGTVKFNQALRPVVDQFLMCVACPAVTQVMSETGDLIDIPGWQIEDLAYPVDFDTTYVVEPVRGQLRGRRDS